MRKLSTMMYTTELQHHLTSLKMITTVSAIFLGILTLLLALTPIISNTCGAILEISSRTGSSNLYPLLESIITINLRKWFNSSIRHNVNRVCTLRCKYNRHPSEQNKLKLENNERLLEAEISSAKADYESSLISSFSYT